MSQLEINIELLFNNCLCSNFEITPAPLWIKKTSKLPHFEIVSMNPIIIKIEISMLFTDDLAVTWRFGKSISRNLKNQIQLNWLLFQTMVGWGSGNFENSQINNYLEMLQPLNLINTCISEGELLNVVFGIDCWRHSHGTY